MAGDTRTIDGKRPAERGRSSRPLSHRTDDLLSHPADDLAPTGRLRAERLLLLDHPDLDLGLYVGVQADRHAIHTKRLDRVVQIDLTLLDHLEALSVKLLGNIGRGDRTEELPLLTNASGEGERYSLEASGDRLRAAATLVLGRLQAGLLLSDALEVPGGGRVRDATRKQIVPGEARRNLHDVSGLAELLDRLAQDDFHVHSSRYVVGRGLLRQSSQVSPRPTPRANTPSSGHMKMARPMVSATMRRPGAKNHVNTPSPLRAYSAPKNTSRLSPTMLNALSVGTATVVIPRTSPQTSWSLKRNSLSGASGAPMRARLTRWCNPHASAST